MPRDYVTGQDPLIDENGLTREFKQPGWGQGWCRCDPPMLDWATDLLCACCGAWIKPKEEPNHDETDF